MKQTIKSSVIGSDTYTMHLDGTVVRFSEGKDEITVNFDNYGRLRVASIHGAVVVKPSASNCFFVEAEKF